MLIDREVQISDFIKFTPGGIIVADYDQVQAALIKRYKDIYGDDIDLSNITADGVFVNDLALIINNILQAFKTLYANLDVETASGIYLDTLCKLSNITRKMPTQSTAYLRISAISGLSSDPILETNTIFVDYSGNEWRYEGNQKTITRGADPIQIEVTCTEYGPIEAKAGSIYQTLQNSSLNVEQDTDALVGRDTETDSELRARRAQSTGIAGNTVLQSLVGALFDLDGIDDVYIKNNNTDTSTTDTDTNTVAAHSVYVVLRKNQNLQIDDETIGTIIYNKLTPGIGTNSYTKGTGGHGIARSFEIAADPETQLLVETIYWKEATPITPTFTVEITPGIYYDYGDTTSSYKNGTTKIIAEAIRQYINKININKLPESNQIIIEGQLADPKFKGNGTYVVSDVNISNITQSCTYFDYAEDDYDAAYSNDKITITFPHQV